MTLPDALFDFFFFFNDTATTEIYTLSLHDALPISSPSRGSSAPASVAPPRCLPASPSPHRKAPSLDFLPVHASGLSHPFRQHPLSSYAPCPPAKQSAPVCSPPKIAGKTLSA